MIWTKIQGDSEEKVNILRDDSTGHSDKEVLMNVRLILNGCRARAVLILRIRNHRKKVKQSRYRPGVAQRVPGN